MGEEEKEKKETSAAAAGEANNNVEQKKEKAAESNNTKNDDEMIIIKVDMHCHCEACAKKIFRALRKFQGVEGVTVDRKTNVVAIKGKTADPLKICDRIRHKTGRKAILLSPLPKPPEEPPKEAEIKDKKEEQPKDDNQPPPVVTVVLRVHMHCEGCAHLLQKRIRKMKGVESVETDLGKSQVIVKGVIADPEVLVKYVHKRTRKQVSIVKDEEEKKQDSSTSEQEKKEEDNKKEKEEDNNNDKEGIKNIIDDAKMMMMGDMNRYDYYWSSARYDYMEYHHHYNNNLNYQPQIFSDENPNSCSIM